MVHSLEKEAVRRESEYQFLKRELETLQREYQSQSEALGNLQLVLQALQKGYALINKRKREMNMC
jgi:exonuclease VII large subunit